MAGFKRIKSSNAVQQHKGVKGSTGKQQKNIKPIAETTQGNRVIWCFDHVDRDGPFAFRPDMDVFLHKDVLDKIVSYCSMKWAEVYRQTHDDGSSKHHMLDIEKLSKPASQRIDALRLEDYADSIFSFALTNKLRIIGIRNGRFFNVVWYDPEHQFCPSQKRHT